MSADRDSDVARGQPEIPPDSGSAAGQSPSAEELLAELDRVRLQADREIELRAERLKRLSEQLRSANAELKRSGKDLERSKNELATVKRELERLQRRRFVRAGLFITNRIRAAWRWRGRLTSRVTSGGRASKTRYRPQASRADEDALIKRLRSGPAIDASSGALVSVVVVPRDSERDLRRSLLSLEQQTHGQIELIVVGTGDAQDTPSKLDTRALRFPSTLVQRSPSISVGAAKNEGVARSQGRYLLFIHDDVVPVRNDALAAMVRRLEADDTIAAVAARLIQPRGSRASEAQVSRAADLTLEQRGIHFVLRDGEAWPENVGSGEDPVGEAATTPIDLPAASAACLLVRRDSFGSVGGFSTAYRSGLEDVDLCLKLRQLGHRTVYEPRAVFWHHASEVEQPAAPDESAGRQSADGEALRGHWGPQLFRDIVLDRLDLSGAALSSQRLRVGITVTRNDQAAGWGDYYTAHELGDALEGLGWHVVYLERWRDGWYEPPDIDVLIALLDAIDVRRLPTGVVTIAWIRNWTDRWLEREWFDEYDIVFASSRRSKELIDAGSVHVAELMPLATNPARFRAIDRPSPAGDVVFVGNHWGAERGITNVISQLASRGISVRLFGKGWEDLPEVVDLAKGPLPYEDVAGVYANAAIVLDDTAGPTLPYAAVNSRVFDALAAGALVITDNVEGANEVFDGGAVLPAATTAEELASLVEDFLARPDDRRALAEILREQVIAHHTYAHRATQIRDRLRAWVSAVRLDIDIGPPTWDEAPSWGDYHFGRGLQKAFQRHGVPTRIRLLPDWDAPSAARADAVIHVFGLSERATRPAQVSALWVISHPELVTPELLEGQDLVFAASDAFADELAIRAGITVRPLHQATDPGRFYPREGGPPHRLLFVANSRNVRRPIVDALTPTDLDFAVYGRGWTPELLDPTYLRGEYVPNADLASFYSAADIVLNDHWPEMARHGFLSNRLYDASACGAFVISDAVAGIDSEFDGGIATFASGAELRGVVDHFLAHPEERAAAAERARKAVLARHTLDIRVAEILGALLPLVASRRYPMSARPADPSDVTAPGEASMANGPPAGGLSGVSG